MVYINTWVKNAWERVEERMNWSESTDWVPSGWVSHNHSHKGDETEAKSTLSSEHRDEWETKWEERQLKFGVCVKWVEVRFLILISNGEFCTFFFFFFEFRPESMVSVDTAQVGPIQHKSTRVVAVSAQVS